MAITKTINLEVNAKDAKKAIDDVTNSTKKLDKANSNTSKSNNTLSAATTKTGVAMGGVATASTTAAGGLTAVGGAVGTAAVGFQTLKTKLQATIISLKSVKVAMMATGIGLVIVLLASLKAAFTGSEEGQNKFAKIMGVIGALTGNLVDLLADLGEGIIDAFENPKQAITDFANLIKDNIVNRFEGLVELIPQLGKAIKLLFSGEFKEAGKVAANAAAKVALGVEDITDKIEGAIDKVKEFADEQIKEGKAAAQVADMRAKADKIERNLIVERSKLESEIALLRLKSREEDKFTAEERKQALLDAQVLEDSLLDKETEYLELRRDAQIQENTFSRSNKENLTKEAEAIAAVNRQVASRANTARQVQREVNTISKQIQAQNKADAAAEKAINDAKIAETKTRLDAIGKIQKEFITKQQDLEAETEIQKIQLEKERKLKELEDLGAHFIAKAQVAMFYENKIQGVKDKNAEDDLKKEKILQNQKIAIVGQTFGTMAAILGENSKAGKAFGIAQALTNTYLGVTEVLGNDTTLPEPFGTIQKVSSIAGVLATGFAAVKSIKSVKPGGGGGGTPSLSGGGGSAPTPPAFNVVGASGESQLADAIGGQTQRPARAYVVSNDVTTAQELDRNIIEGASI